MRPAALAFLALAMSTDAFAGALGDQGPFISDLTVRGKEVVRAPGATEVAAPAAAGSIKPTPPKRPGF